MVQVAVTSLIKPQPSDEYTSDLGKVLAGIQVPPNEYSDFNEYLSNLGYPFVEETENEVYKRYLRG